MFKRSLIFRALAFFTAVSVAGSAAADIGSILGGVEGLPEPGTIVGLSEAYSSPFLVGVNYDEADPFKLDFIVDPGDAGRISMEERGRLVRYFLAALTIPEDKLWVNLSPYENERIIDDKTASTELGEVLLEQDYILKQLTASLSHPDADTGRSYWDLINNNPQSEPGTDSFNKVWIVPEKISVYEDNASVVITEASLDVRTEADYIAMKKNGNADKTEEGEISPVKKIILPEIKRDVNSGKNFAVLRQMMHSAVLAQWFKRKFADSLYSFYFDTEKTRGIDTVDPVLKEKVFERYVESFNTGAYDVTKKERIDGRLVKRRYFSGGVSSSIFEVIARGAVKQISLSELYKGMGKEFLLMPVRTSINETDYPAADIFRGIAAAAASAVTQEDVQGVNELLGEGMSSVNEVAKMLNLYVKGAYLGDKAQLFSKCIQVIEETYFQTMQRIINWRNAETIDAARIQKVRTGLTGVIGRIKSFANEEESYTSVMAVINGDAEYCLKEMLYDFWETAAMDARREHWKTHYKSQALNYLSYRTTDLKRGFIAMYNNFIPGLVKKKQEYDTSKKDALRISLSRSLKFQVQTLVEFMNFQFAENTDSADPGFFIKRLQNLIDKQISEFISDKENDVGKFWKNSFAELASEIDDIALKIREAVSKRAEWPEKISFDTVKRVDDMYMDGLRVFYSISGYLVRFLDNEKDFFSSKNAEVMVSEMVSLLDRHYAPLLREMENMAGDDLKVQDLINDAETRLGQVLQAFRFTDDAQERTQAIEAVTRGVLEQEFNNNWMEIAMYMKKAFWASQDKDTAQSYVNYYRTHLLEEASIFYQHGTGEINSTLFNTVHEIDLLFIMETEMQGYEFKEPYGPLLIAVLENPGERLTEAYIDNILAPLRELIDKRQASSAVNNTPDAARLVFSENTNDINGGIDLNGLLDGVTISKSSSAVISALHPAENISGVSFEFAGEGRMMPIDQIILPARSL